MPLHHEADVQTHKKASALQPKISGISKRVGALAALTVLLSGCAPHAARNIPMSQLSFTDYGVVESITHIQSGDGNSVGKGMTIGAVIGFLAGAVVEDSHDKSRAYSREECHRGRHGSRCRYETVVEDDNRYSGAALAGGLVGGLLGAAAGAIQSSATKNIIKIGVSLPTPDDAEERRVSRTVYCVQKVGNPALRIGDRVAVYNKAQECRAYLPSALPAVSTGVVVPAITGNAR
jgi:uncharacterized protein YcfJ